MGRLGVVKRGGSHLLAIFVTLGAAPACAQSTVPLSPRAAGQTVSHPIAWFTGDKSAIEFKGEESDFTFSVPEPANMAFSKVSLHLKGIASPALLAPDSTMLVSVNGAPAGLVPFNNHGPRIDKTISLPPGAFEPGYNVVALRSVETTGMNCERFGNPALWARLSSQSTITIAEMKKSIDPTMNALGQVFDKHDLTHRAAVTVLYNKTVAAHPAALVGVSQGIGLRYDYLPVAVHALPLTSSNRQIVMAEPGNVVLLDATPTTAVPRTPGNVKMTLAPKDGGEVLTMMGNWQAIQRAGRLIGTDEVAWPNQHHAIIHFQHFPSAIRGSWPKGGDKGPVYFRTLGYKTTTSYGPSMNFGDIQLWNGSWGGRAVVTLHLAYGAGSQDGSVVDLLANGAFVGSIPMQNPDGGTYKDYKVVIPRNVLRIGQNQINLRGVVHRQGGSSMVCVSAVHTKGVPVTLFSDSYVYVAGGSRIMRDNLAAVTAVGVGPRTIVIAGHHAQTLSAAATIAAKLAQVSHVADISATVLSRGENLRDAIVVGPSKDLPSNLLLKAGLDYQQGDFALRDAMNVAYPVKGPSAFEQLPDWIEGTLRLHAPDHIGGGDPLMISGYGSDAVVAIVPAERSATVILTAPSSSVLASGAMDLVGWSHWAALAGHADVITGADQALSVVPARIELSGIRARAGYFTTEHIGVTILIVLALFFACVFLINIGLKARQKSSHSAPPTKDMS